MPIYVLLVCSVSIYLEHSIVLSERFEALRRKVSHTVFTAHSKESRNHETFPVAVRKESREREEGDGERGRRIEEYCT
jgi:hypothetical protein